MIEGRGLIVKNEILHNGLRGGLNLGKGAKSKDNWSMTFLDFLLNSHQTVITKKNSSLQIFSHSCPIVHLSLPISASAKEHLSCSSIL